jgi:hypothetical protein
VLLPSHFGRIQEIVKGQLDCSAQANSGRAGGAAAGGYNGPQPPHVGGKTRMAGEAPIKRAVKWIDDQLHDNPALNRLKLVDEAARRFDLSPLDAEFLLRHLAERPTK